MQIDKAVELPSFVSWGRGNKMKNKIKAYAVVGAGYGDEGKGLMTDYICSDKTRGGERTLNIKTNGGSQAGHTVCKLGRSGYKHWVFHSLGSGSFAGADTYLSKDFILDIQRLHEERDNLARIYDTHPRVIIDSRCIVVLPSDWEFNTFIERARSQRHGSCGLGIYEAFHRNELGYAFTIGDMTSCKNRDELKKLAEEQYNKYINIRANEICNELKEQGRLVGEKEKEQLFENCRKGLDQWVNYVDVYMGWIYGCEQPEWSRIDEIAKNDIVVVKELQKDLGGIYNKIVWENGQGLELDMGDKRNKPHLTPSNTGTTNIVNTIKESGIGENIDELNIVYVTRSYKTKHGAGNFVEYDGDIAKKWGLYDRTNATNEFQGTLQYGRLDMGRMQELIERDFNKLNEQLKDEVEHIEGRLAITHLDQTNGLLLTSHANIDYTEVYSGGWLNGGITYYAFGEKSTDVLERT